MVQYLNKHVLGEGELAEMITCAWGNPLPWRKKPEDCDTLHPISTPTFPCRFILCQRVSEILHIINQPPLHFQGTQRKHGRAHEMLRKQLCSLQSHMAWVSHQCHTQLLANFQKIINASSSVPSPPKAHLAQPPSLRCPPDEIRDLRLCPRSKGSLRLHWALICIQFQSSTHPRSPPALLCG